MELTKIVNTVSCQTSKNMLNFMWESSSDFVITIAAHMAVLMGSSDNITLVMTQAFPPPSAPSTDGT
jgi:hypothetical protein